MKNKIAFLIFIISLLFGNNFIYAKVTGPCVNCHTMHNSQNGVEVIAGGPYGILLVNNCIGCHTGTNTGTNTTPYVYSTSEPVFGTNTLAGGNFYWVTTDDTKGHNVFIDNDDNNLSAAPGDQGLAYCSTNSCHANLNRPVSNSGFSNLDGRQGCTKCHMVTTNGYPKGYHHANDGTGTKFVNSASQGWYRFLAGHIAGGGKGVIGIEHEKWNYGATASSHNEYSGYVYYGSFGFDAQDYPQRYTTTAYCTGCHGLFHIDQRIGDEVAGNPWSRHPSDAIIPNTGEYASISTTYNPMVPVARDVNTFNWAGGPSSTVTPGSDMVMCLSCHVAHGSPYPDLLRWDYSTMIAGGGSSGGCFTCHTQKK